MKRDMVAQGFCLGDCPFMEWAWDVIKNLGSLVGLATGGFVVWDRFYRMTPTAVVVVRPLSEASVFKALYLQIRNPADRPILVQWKNGIRKGRFGLMVDDSTRSTIVSILDGESTVAIDAGESKEFRLLPPQDVAEIEPENSIEIDVHWRFAQPKIWKRDRKIRVSLPKRSLMHLDSNDYAAENEAT